MCLKLFSSLQSSLKKSTKAQKVLFYSDLLKAFTAIFRPTSKLVIDLHVFKALKKESPLDSQHSPTS